jgi:anti-sigma B factor antagonist
MDITVTSMEKCDLVVISGRIDSYTAPNLSEALNKLASDERNKLILELSGVNYVSSAGLRVLIDIQKTCKKSDHGEVLLVHTPQRVYETLELAGFVPLFRFFTDVESAVAAF